MIDQFLIWLKACRSKATVSSYDYALRGFRTFLRHLGKDVTECTLQDLSIYINSLETKGLKSGTRNLYSTALRSLWAWLYQQGKVPFNEKLIPMPQITDKEPYPACTLEEYRSIIGALSLIDGRDVRNKAVLSLLWDTGVRIDECMSIDIGDLNLAEKEGQVKTFKRKNHRRTIFWTNDTNINLGRWIEYRKEVLKEWGVSCNALFLSLSNCSTPRRLHKSSIQKRLREIRDQLGIEKPISPHSFRHGFGTEMTRGGANPRYLQVMMGHAKITTTQQYMGWREKDVVNEYRKMRG